MSHEKIVSSTRRQSDEYSIRFEHFGWIVAHVSDATGVLSIASDWGNWSYRWNTQHLGHPTLTEFLLAGDIHYIANKLIAYGRDRYANLDKTRKVFRETVCASRRAKLLSRAAAQELWSEISLWEGGELPGEFTWEDVVFEDTPEFMNLKEIVLPALLDVMRSSPAETDAATMQTAVSKIRETYESGGPVLGLHSRADVGVLLREIARLEETLRHRGT